MNRTFFPVHYRVAIWLTFVSLVSIIFVVFCLSAVQIQIRIQSFSPDGQHFSIWQAKTDGEQLRTINNNIAPLNSERQEIEIDINNVEESLLDSNIKYTAKEDIVRKIERDTVAEVNKMNLNFVVNVDETFEQSYSRLASLLNTISADTNAILSALRRNIDELDEIGTNISTGTTKLEKLKLQLSEVESKIKATRERSQDQIFGNLAVENRRQYQDIIEELSIVGENYKIIAALTQTPQELLTIFLVIAMGILGSSLYLSQIFLIEGGGYGFSFYLFRPFFGALTALALFIALKAGVIVVADPVQSGGGGAPLNPYFVSFVGIVGGLISEQVMEQIRGSAQRWLRAATRAQERWAVGIEEQISEAGKEVSDLRSYFDVDDSVFDGWLQERRRVPPDAQRIISAWLGKDARVLFTDIPPEQQQQDDDKDDGT